MISRAALRYSVLILGLCTGSFLCGLAQKGLIPEFEVEPGPLTLSRPANPGAPFTKSGRKFAILGVESGSFEAWAYPLKLLRNFELSFLLGSSTRPLAGRDLVRRIDVNPEATVLTFVHQAFTVRAIYITPLEEPGALVLLDVDSTEPLTVVASFLPVLQPMWPARHRRAIRELEQRA